ncbi:hypothetical protein BASA81_001373 [Batrachochytrium salamandrivorans]|nr:hypothetical protein BASA81_001373 [Batrachochytrium salamandrivorans]
MKARRHSSFSDEEEEDEYDEEANWAGGSGFVWEGDAHKWKSTRKFLFWPLYSESISITASEVHVKRNDCPALPRECRPFRAWATAPLKNIKGFYMRKTVFRVLDWLALLVLSIVLGCIAAGVISSQAVPFGSTSSLNGLESASDVLGFVLDASFFIFALVIGISVCCLGALCMTLRAPLRLVLNVEGVPSHDSESFSIDLIPGRVQPEEIKAKVDEFLNEAASPAE